MGASAGPAAAAVLQVMCQPRYMLTLLAVSAAGVLVWRQRRRYRRYPPGLPVLPIVGSLPFLDKKLPFYKNMHNLSQKHGNVCSLTVGMRPTVVISGLSTIREAFVNKSVAFSGRPETYLRSKMVENPRNIGIADGTYSPEWKAQRNVMMSLLRSLGYGQSTTEEKILSECQTLVDIIDRQSGKPWDPEVSITIGANNVVCHLLFGERYPHGDEEFQAIMEHLRQFIQHLLGHPEYEFIPFLQYLPTSRNFIAKCEMISNNVLQFLQKRIQARKESYDPAMKPNDLVEAYLQQLHDNNSRITEDWLQQTCVEFFVAGTDTTANTILWLLLYMLLYPDVQDKVQEELDHVLQRGEGHYRSPKLSDRVSLPYLVATIMEVERLSALLPVSVPHSTITDVELEGYLIPKGTIIWPNIYGTTIDPAVWKDPKKFDPTRFLDENGQLQKRAELMPFGIGRRKCIAEQLAKHEVFLFFSSVLFHYRLSLPDDLDVLPTTEAQHADTIRKPQPYTLCATRRH